MGKVKSLRVFECCDMGVMERRGKGMGLLGLIINMQRLLSIDLLKTTVKEIILWVT